MSTATPISAPETDMQQLATDVVERALRAGATEAEVVIREGDEFSTLVRLGQVETLKESGSRGIGLRVFLGPGGAHRTASTSTSDFSPAGLDHLVSGAIDLAQVTSEDPFAGLPEPGAIGQLAGDLDLYYEDVYSLPAAQRIDYARRAEAAALADTRIQQQRRRQLRCRDRPQGARQLPRIRRRISPLLLLALRHAHRAIGARRDAARLLVLQRAHPGPPRFSRKYRSRSSPPHPAPPGCAPCPHPERAHRLCPGDRPLPHRQHLRSRQWRQHLSRRLFLANQLGEQVASANVTVIDDGTMLGWFGTSPFDGEGLPTRRTVIVENGMLKNYLLNTYTARKLNMQSTGNASRGLAGKPGIGAGNLFLENGSLSPQQLLADVKAGFYVTELMGLGVNMVTGDYSRGASGLWIENGELTFAVEEVTIAGNLKEMFSNITAIGDDLVFRGAVASPTLRIDGMTIAGE